MAVPTPIDFINATFYATDSLKKKLCNSPTTKKKYPGTQWVSKNPPPYSCPPGLTCDHGNCKIVTEEECNKHSQLPWGPGGVKLDGPSCKKDDDCKNSSFEAICSSKKKCIPKNPYLEWHPSSATGPAGICQFGNFALRKWCEYPSTRRTSSENGVTNVPPFKYNAETGNCEITKDYCDWMEVSYKIDDKNRPTCYTKTGQKIGEFIMGKTIFRSLKRVTEDKDVKEGYNQYSYKASPSLVEGFNKLDHVQKLADEKYILDKNIISKNFGGPGIHLYHIVWKRTSVDKDKGTAKDGMGMLAKEVKKVYPDAVTVIDGDMYISITKDQVRKNPKLKRIYLTSSSGNWMLKTFIGFLGNFATKK